MSVTEDIISQAKDSITVKRIFGDPIEKDGVTFVPAAKVGGGGGGGGGTGKEGDEGSGGGFGMQGRPVGAFVFKDGDWRWEPAIDVNRIVAGVMMVVIVLILAVKSVRKASFKRKVAA
jgi:uncharacterized spore protein YtfJ